MSSHTNLHTKPSLGQLTIYTKCIMTSIDDFYSHMLPNTSIKSRYHTPSFLCTQTHAHAHAHMRTHTPTACVHTHTHTSPISLTMEARASRKAGRWRRLSSADSTGEKNSCSLRPTISLNMNWMSDGFRNTLHGCEGVCVWGGGGVCVCS